jgi:hypothetical protein
MEARESEHIDRLVEAVATLSYFLLAIAFLPHTEYVRALGSGLVVFAIVLVVAWKLGRRIQSGWSVLVVGFVASAALCIPAFPAMGNTSGRAVPIGFLGAQAAVLLWIAFWWQGPREEPSHISFFAATRFGLLVAAGVSGTAAIPVLLLLLSGGESSWAILLVFPAYFVGFQSAAIVYWALQRIENLGVGRYLLGVLGGACVYGAIGPAVAIFDHKPIHVHDEFVEALILGALIGPTLALSSYEKSKARLAKRTRRKIDGIAT